jgi:hypothetical protein
VEYYLTVLTCLKSNKIQECSHHVTVYVRVSEAFLQVTLVTLVVYSTLMVLIVHH